MLTDNEIYEALHNAGESIDYEKVYLWHWVRDEPIIIRFRDVVDLINRQQAEIERLKGKVNLLMKYDERRDTSFHARLTEKARGEAIKEFEDKIKDKFDKHGVDYTAYAIVDDVAKELVGEDK